MRGTLRPWALALLAQLALAAPLSGDATSEVRQDRDMHKRFDYDHDKIRGVNLGGWFVLEPFLTPTLFNNTGNPAIVDEWTFCQLQDRSTAESALRHHWDTFITANDFVEIAAAGLDHVRIPVGYWMLDVEGSEPFIQGSEEFLDRALGWARDNGLRVLIDLHGAPGSQNGNDHSGHLGPVDWPHDPVYVARTVEVIRQLAAKYGSPPFSDTVTMIELLNEPAVSLSDEMAEVTKQYYLAAYEAARWPWGKEAGNQTELIIVFHDGFRELLYWDGFMTGPGFEKVWIDDHYYQVFGVRDANATAEEHLRRVCEEQNNFATSPFPSINGEFSIYVPPCIPAERESSLGNVGTCDKTEPNGEADYTTFTQAYFALQVELFENVGQGRGWFYYTWKSEDWEEWSYKTSRILGWIPFRPWDHQFHLDTVCAAA